MERLALFRQHWDHIRQFVGIGLRCVERIPADQLDARPIRDMRTPRELAVHTFVQLPMMTEGVLRGEVVAEDEEAALASMRSLEDLVRFCNECWSRADAAASAMTESRLQAIVKTPWNFSAPAPAMIGTLQDEFTHHRGQLYAYLRQMGVAPPKVWDFANNPPAHRPRAPQST